MKDEPTPEAPSESMEMADFREKPTGVKKRNVAKFDDDPTSFADDGQSFEQLSNTMKLNKKTWKQMEMELEDDWFGYRAKQLLLEIHRHRSSLPSFDSAN